MSISEESIAKVVADASSKMHQPEYISSQVDRFMGAQPQISQYVISHSDELTVEGVVTVLFHSALIMESVSRSKGMPGLVDVPQLDLAVKEVPDLESLAKILEGTNYSVFLRCYHIHRPDDLGSSIAARITYVISHRV